MRRIQRFISEMQASAGMAQQTSREHGLPETKWDGAADRAALTLPWSSGQADGQINRLKLLRRQMYGRANPDPLRQRTRLAA